MNAKKKAQEVISSIMTLKEYTVVRHEHEVLFNGTVPYNIKHRTGSPFLITVPAHSQMEAEEKVDIWQEKMRSE